MAGQEVFKHAVVKLAETGAAALARAGLTTADVDWLVPHQANLRIMTMTAHKLGRADGARRRHRAGPRQHLGRLDSRSRSRSRTPRAASCPGDVLLMEAIGGGLAWGAAVVRW